jgi:HPt (histidine-containing phosphotransfer) domain-containing protein
LFLEDCPARLAAIKLAIDRGDADQIRETAHALKGAAGNLSATGLFEAASTLERLGGEHRIDAAREPHGANSPSRRQPRLILSASSKRLDQQDATCTL